MAAAFAVSARARESKTCTTLLTSGRLNAYPAEIDKQAQERIERLTEQMKQPKAGHALEWVRRINSIRACATEIVNKKIIFA